MISSSICAKLLTTAKAVEIWRYDLIADSSNSRLDYCWDWRKLAFFERSSPLSFERKLCVLSELLCNLFKREDFFFFHLAE